MINATITLIKNSKKANISYSQSFVENQIRSYNFTGTLTSLEGYITSDGKDVSDVLITSGVATTVIISNIAMAEAIIEKALQIFTERERVGDKNPAIELSVKAKTLKVSGNILINLVTQAFVSEEAFIKDDAETILKRLEEVKKTRLGMTMARVSQEEISQEKEVTSGIKTISNFIKRYF